MPGGGQRKRETQRLFPYKVMRSLAPGNPPRPARERMCCLLGPLVQVPTGDFEKGEVSRETLPPPKVSRETFGDSKPKGC